MAKKIVGYGIVGPNEPYLEQTLKEFARLCDETILCLNNPTPKERQLVQAYGFKHAEDNREWGVNQWKIKEDFVNNYVAGLKPDICLCLDMDEVMDKHLTKERLQELSELPFEAYYFRIINLWDDGYAPDRSFWNIRAWKWNDIWPNVWRRSPVHCGLAPAWTYNRGYYVPFILKHYGLKDADRRELKAKRYDKYDPNAKFMSRDYYNALRSGAHVLPFDEDELHQEVVKYVHDIRQQYVKPPQHHMDLVQIKIPNGEIVTVPKAKLNDYLRRPGHEYVADYQIVVDKIDELLEEVTVEPVEEKPVIEKPVIEELPVKEEPKVLGKLKKWSWNE